MKSKTGNNYNNADALGQFLNKAQMGRQMQPSQQDIVDVILDELTLDPDTESIVSKLQSQFGISYEDALDRVDEVVSMLYQSDTAQQMIPEQEDVDEEEIEPIAQKYNYELDAPSAADDMYYQGDTGWEDEDDLAMEDDQALSLERKGGTISKKKFVKDTVRKLKKASEGMEQSESNEADIRDTPIGGRQSLVNNFRRGIKDLGNEYYAKDIYDKTMQLQQEMNNPFLTAQEGAEVDNLNMNMQETDIENPMHHLQAYSSAVSDIFKQPMNQVHGAGYEMPEAKKGREQKEAARTAKQVGKDWKKMFGDIAVGYMGVPGMPSYLSMIPPGMMANQMHQVGMTHPMNVPGPLVNMSFKKGPWWSGKREWTAEGIPANMLMGMGMGMVPQYGFGNQSMGYDTRRRYPGEIIRTKTTVPVVSKRIGGAVDDPEMDQYGNLERFVYGGNEMPEPPILQYEDDYMSSKNVDDPFMFKEGGLYKYQGTGNSQVNPDDYNAWLRQRAEKEALAEYNEWMNRNAENPATYNANTNDRVYQQILQRKMAGLTGQQNQSNQGTGMSNQYPQLRGQYPQMRSYYPTAPSIGQQLRGMFSPIRKDFSWFSQAGPPTTLDGQPFQMPTQMPAQNQRWAEVTDEYGNKKLMPLDQAERTNLPHKEVAAPKGMTGQPNLMQPGYMYDVRYDKGSFWKGSPKSVTFTGRWVDPNNPNAGTQSGAASTKPAPGAPNAGTSTQQNKPSTTIPGSNTSTSSKDADIKKGVLMGQQSPMRGAVNPDGSSYTDARRLDDALWLSGQTRKDFREQGPALFGDSSGYTQDELKQQYEEAGGFGKARMRRQFKRDGLWDTPLQSKEFGGYIPEFNPGGQFDPNVNNQMDNCTDSEKMNPNSMCYDPTFKPQDFQVKYDINDAYTLNTGNIANIMGAVGTGIQEIGAAVDNNYNRGYLADRTTSDNMVPTNYLDYRGGYSGLNQRPMAPGFTGVVGNASFVKEGGQIKYREGGVYDLDQAEIGRILAAGGQIEFI